MTPSSKNYFLLGLVATLILIVGFWVYKIPSNTLTDTDAFRASVDESSENSVAPNIVITWINVNPIYTNSVVINWNTNVISDGWIEYGTSESYGQQTSPAGILNEQHHMEIADGVDIGATYHFRLHSIDSFGNEAVSGDQMVTTAITPEMSGKDLIFSKVGTEIIEPTTATIYFDSGIPASVSVEYGETNSYGNFIDTTGTDTAHGVRINSLSPDTVYHYRLVANLDKGTVVSDDYIFTTPSEPPPVAPAISAVSVSEIGETSVTISWETDLKSTSQIDYGLSSEYGQSTEIDDALTKKHSQTLDGLEPGTEYHFRVVSTNADELTSYSIDSTFTTTGKPTEASVKPRVGPTGYRPSTIKQSSLDEINPNESLKTTEENKVRIENSKESNQRSQSRVSKVQAAGLDKLIFLSWENPSADSFNGVRIVRSTDNYSLNPSVGDLVYEGNGKVFSDPNLENGKTYFYSIFTAESDGYTEPVRLSIAPYAERRHYHLLEVGVSDTQSPVLTIPNLIPGQTGDEVGHVQELLATDPTIYPEGLITNYFGELTEAAVKRLQYRFGLPETGIVDEGVRQALANLPINQTLSEIIEPCDIQAYAHDIYFGACDDSVRELQKFLVDKGYLEADLLTGYFGKLTESAVIRFQADNGLPPTGYVGPLTRAKILEQLGN